MLLLLPLEVLDAMLPETSPFVRVDIKSELANKLVFWASFIILGVNWGPSTSACLTKPSTRSFIIPAPSSKLSTTPSNILNKSPPSSSNLLIDLPIFFTPPIISLTLFLISRHVNNVFTWLRVGTS